MLRVIHVIGRLPRHGTQRQLIGMIRCAHGRRWDATLAVLRSGDPLAREAARDGIPVVEFDAPDADPRRLWWLRRLIRAADVVHASLWGANAFTRVASATVRHRPAVVISERSVETTRPRTRRMLDRALRPWTDAYIANSNDVARFVADAHGVPTDRVTVIPNGIDGSVFFPPAERRRDGPVKLGTVGRLIPEKGLDVLLAAMPAIMASRPIELTIVGDGPERPRLERSARGLPVVFAGELTEPADVASFLRSIDVFVMPSRWEGRPNALLEAIACGAATVASDVPGMAEASSEATLLIPPDRPAALADAVGQALESPARSTAPQTGFPEVAVAHLMVYERAHRGRKQSP